MILALESILQPPKTTMTMLVDIEQKSGENAYLTNTTIGTFAWQGINVSIKDGKSSQSKAILENVEGYVNAGNKFLNTAGGIFF